jgi:hypothetical protein
MNTTTRFGLSILLAAAIALPAAAAFDYPLSSMDIRSAYFLGTQNDERSADVFLQYVHQLPIPKIGPYMGDIGIDTPYTQVAELCAMVPNDHAQEAEQKYLGKPMSFLVHADIYLTSSFASQSLSPADRVFESLPDFWSGFRFHLTQGKEIPVKSISERSIYSAGQGNAVPVGEKIELEYDVTKITSDEIRIEVDTPDGQHVETMFNLAKLK